MARFTVTHEIDCTPDAFWQLFFDKEFNVALYRKGLEFPAFEVLEQTENDKEIFRKASGQPKLSLPGPVMKLLGDGFRYTEDGTFDKATRVWRWKMKPSTLADKLKNEGSVRVEPLGEKRVKRIADLVMEAKIFGIGGLMESSGEKSLREGWDKSAAFMNKWIKEKGIG